MTNDPPTTWICKTEPHCRCFDHDCVFTCECVKSPTMARCRFCAARLVEIDIDTSLEVA